LKKRTRTNGLVAARLLYKPNAYQSLTFKIAYLTSLSIVD
jgi:hypothetical protein